MTSYINQPSNVSSFGTPNKNVSTFSTQTASIVAGLWNAATLPWQLALPWQFQAEGVPVYTNQPKS